MKVLPKIVYGWRLILWDRAQGPSLFDSHIKRVVSYSCSSQSVLACSEYCTQCPTLRRHKILYIMLAIIFAHHTTKWDKCSRRGYRGIVFRAYTYVLIMRSRNGDVSQHFEYGSVFVQRRYISSVEFSNTRRERFTLFIQMIVIPFVLALFTSQLQGTHVTAQSRGATHNKSNVRQQKQARNCNT